MSENKQNTNAFLIHLSSFGDYLFPLGSIILPLILWEVKKKDSEFLDATGKEVINFNLSYLTYTIVLVITMIMVGVIFMFGHVNPLNIFFIVSAVVLVGIISIIKFILIIIGVVKANQGELYHYPLTIKFLK
ncbi:MAG: DUF4870 domain-containing protein [Flavobacteriia bacterium]|nr:MAG: DUF4870 domain-containing protein [Flavobacteriia bacterium]